MGIIMVNLLIGGKVIKRMVANRFNSFDLSISMIRFVEVTAD